MFEQKAKHVNHNSGTEPKKPLIFLLIENRLYVNIAYYIYRQS